MLHIDTKSFKFFKHIIWDENIVDNLTGCIAVGTDSIAQVLTDFVQNLVKDKHPIFMLYIQDTNHRG